MEAICWGWQSRKTETRSPSSWSIHCSPRLLNSDYMWHVDKFLVLPSWLRWSSIYLQCWRPRFHPWVRKIPWRRKWQPTPVLLRGKSHGQRSLVGYSPWGHKESDTTGWLYLLTDKFLTCLNYIYIVFIMKVTPVFLFTVTDWMFVSPQSSYGEILTPMVLEGRAFERWLGHEGGAPMNGISVFMKEAPESTLAPPAMWGHSENTSVSQEGGLSPDTEPASTLVLDCPTSRIVRNKCLLFRPPAYGTFVMGAWKD